MKNNLVSVILTTQNRKVLLQRALNSVINQTYKNIEIIIIDDFSEDQTDKIICNYMVQYPNIRYIRNEKIYGANASRNRGILEAKGKFITGLDDDDEFVPTRIEHLLNAYESRYAFVSSFNMIVRPDKTVSYTGEKLEVSLDDILTKNWIGNQVLVEKERIISVGMYDETMAACQDYDLWVRLISTYGSSKVVPEYLQIVHEDDGIHRISLKSKNKSKGNMQFYKKYKMHMSDSQRKFQIYNLYYKVNERHMSKKNALALIDQDNHAKIIDWYVKTSFVGYKVVVAFCKYLATLSRDEKYIIYGYGTIGKMVTRYLNVGQIVGIIDESLNISTIDGYRVLSINELSYYQDVKILITPFAYQDDIAKKLLSVHSKYEIIHLLL